MPTSRRAHALRLVATGCFVALAAACSSSGHSNAATNGGSTGSGAGSGATAPAGVPSAAGRGSDAKYCAAIKVSDAQPLAKATLNAAKSGGPGSCEFLLPGQDVSGDNISVTVFPDDGDKKYYNDHLGFSSAKSQPVAGDPDAVWNQAVDGSAPMLIAHKGSTTCVVIPPADESNLTIGQHGSGVPGLNAASLADAQAYATKEAPVCDDVFSVGS
jgi:hypothetical protein